MDSAEVQILIRKIENAITIFDRPEILCHHLKIFRSNPNTDWYNAALIAMDKSLEQSGFSIIRSQQEWAGLVADFGLKRPGIDLLWPVYNAETGIFKWTIQTRYSIFDYGLEAPENEEDVPMPLKIAREKFDLESLIDRQKDGWQETFIDSYLHSKDEFLSLSEAEKSYIKAAVTLAWGSSLGMNARIKKSSLILDECLKSIHLYRVLFTLVTEFIPYLIEWMIICSDSRTNVRSRTLEILYGGKSE